ncbi:MAG: FAD:protein FMN transferase [Bacteroides sp.]|nr:FAD:protein FMN transferase [Bacteroides sp.]
MGLEQMANYYDTGSELYKLNQLASKQPVALSQELYSLIESALRYREETCGCFDISVQSRNYNKDTWQGINLLPELTSVSFQQPGIQVDLSGFLKGYALEKIRNLLSEYTIKDALINLGNSSVLAVGSHPYGEGWKVGFDNNPTFASRPEILLQDECLTTSGNNTSGRKHIISPLTGQPVEGVKYVAVVTPGGVEGEVLSTGLFVATSAQRSKIMKSFPIKNMYLS